MEVKKIIRKHLWFACLMALAVRWITGSELLGLTIIPLELFLAWLYDYYA